MMMVVVMVVMMEEPFTIGIEVPDNARVDDRHPDHKPAKLSH